MQQNNNDKPLFQLTVGEFLELMKQSTEALSNSTVTNTCQQPQRYFYGLSGLASILGCSIPTASRIKKSGIIDEAITQFQRKIVIDGDMVRSILKNKKIA